MIAYITEIVRLGLGNLALHKLRSVLTSLGIILGVAAVIVVVSIGEGKQTIRTQGHRGSWCDEHHHPQRGNLQRRPGAVVGATLSSSPTVLEDVTTEDSSPHSVMTWFWPN